MPSRTCTIFSFDWFNRTVISEVALWRSGHRSLSHSVPCEGATWRISFPKISQAWEPKYSGGLCFISAWCHADFFVNRPSGYFVHVANWWRVQVSEPIICFSAEVWKWYKSTKGGKRTWARHAFMCCLLFSRATSWARVAGGLPFYSPQTLFWWSQQILLGRRAWAYG